MAWSPDGEQLDRELFDAIAEFIGQMIQRGENLSKQLGVPVFCLKAVHRLGPSATMKDLGEQMHCDRSFVTMIADMLEERGLAKREAHEVDRRLKNLVLTEEGLELKQQLEELLGAQMPWSQALDTSERQHLLELIRKMTKAATSAPAPICGGESVGEVNARLGTASPAAM